MSVQPPEKKSRSLMLGGIIGVVLAVFVGIICLLPAGDGLARLSYDLLFTPYLFRTKPPDELVMVYLDNKAKHELGQPADEPLDRRFYTELLQRLTDDGAKLILFDILFDTPNSNPATDEQFVQAIRRHGQVVLVGDYIKQFQGNVMMDGPLPPLSMFTEVAGWGLGKISPDADFAIRQLDTGVADFPSVSWTAAAQLNAPVTKHPQSRLDGRWLNYFCPPDQFRAVNFDHALNRDGLPAGYFRGKIVVVGARAMLGVAGAAREEFPNPFTRFGKPLSSGPAVNALSLLNLLHGDWLVRVKFSSELLIVVAWGIFISLLLVKFRPWSAIGAGIFCAALFAVVAGYVQLKQHLWFAWLIPAFAQTFVAIVWSVGYQYVVETRRRRQMRRAFSAYLSPYMADQIADSSIDVALGGHEVEASVMFTDLEGFTKMSESLPPAEVSKILTTYFNHATRAILEQDGTIIKYIGDAVLAVWGAPLPEKRHAQRAVLAAWGMSQAGKEDIHGRRLRTRIGVNTGLMLAGNLGSDFRFDYTVIGDTVNFAARLEGLNKYLGTDVLISEFTAQQLDCEIKLRSLGRFIVSGKKQAIGIFEVLGPAANFPSDPPWLTAFNQAREHFVKRELAASEKLLREAITLRDGKDGPAEFYLHAIVHARKLAEDAPWDGTVKLDAK